MRKTERLKFRLVEFETPNGSQFDLELWLADLLVDYWLETNKDIASSSTDHLQNHEIVWKNKNQKVQETLNGL